MLILIGTLPCLGWTSSDVVDRLPRVGAAGDPTGIMAYEYPTACGVLRLQRLGRRWAVQFEGSRRVAWPTAEAAAKAVARGETGLPAWDAAWQDVSDDLLDWRPIGDSL
jgi:hypothetical protein